MGFAARQITLVASTATPLLVQGTTGTKFSQLVGSVTGPVPCQIKNEDASAVVWIGGSDVSATKGQSLNAGQTLPLNLYGSDVPYAFSTGTPIVSVLLGQQ